MGRKFSGRRLREVRLAAGLKPERLALLIDRSVYSVHQYERGTALPSAAVLGALSDTLGVPIDALYERPEAVAHVG